MVGDWLDGDCMCSMTVKVMHLNACFSKLVVRTDLFNELNSDHQSGFDFKSFEMISIFFHNQLHNKLNC